MAGHANAVSLAASGLIWGKPAPRLIKKLVNLLLGTAFLDETTRMCVDMNTLFQDKGLNMNKLLTALIAGLFVATTAIAADAPKADASSAMAAPAKKAPKKAAKKAPKKAKKAAADASAPAAK